MTSDAKLQYSQKDSKVINFIREQAQVRLASQIDIIKAQDTRSLGLLAVSGTLSAAGLAISAARFGKVDEMTLFWTAVLFTSFCILAAVAAAIALWPIAIYLPGWNPEQFKQELDRNVTWEDLEPDVVSALNGRLDDNNKTMKRNGFWAQLSMAMLAGSPLAGTGAFLFTAGHNIFGTVLLILALLLPGTTAVVHLAKRAE